MNHEFMVIYSDLEKKKKNDFLQPGCYVAMSHDAVKTKENGYWKVEQLDQQDGQG